MVKKAKSTGRTEAPRVASTNPDEMVQAGLPDDFDGRISLVRYSPWNYNGNLDHYTLAVAVTIIPDEDSGLEEFTQFYSAGDLKNWVPSDDGEEPSGGDLDTFQALGEGRAEAESEEDLEAMRGIYALGVGRQQGLPNSSNFAFFLRCLRDAEYKGEFSADVSGYEGIHAHFTRIAPPTRKGIQVEEGRKGPGDVLVVTEILPDSGSGGGKATTKGKAAEEEEESGDDDNAALSSQVEEAIVEALTEAKNTSLNQAAVPKVILAAFKGDSNLKAALDLWKSEGWRGDEERAWEFDEDTGVLSIG